MILVLLQFLCDPHEKSILNLFDSVYDEAEMILADNLVPGKGCANPTLNGIRDLCC